MIFRYVVAERIGTILMSALVAHTAWHWATERGDRLTQYRWPGIEMADVAAFMRLAMVIVAAAFLMWLMSLWIGAEDQPRAPGTGPEAPARASAVARRRAKKP